MKLKKTLPTQWMITNSLQVDPIRAAQKLPKNSGIIMRDYDLSYIKRCELALALKKICVTKKIPLLIALDADLAIKIKADGIHMPEYAVSKINFWRRKKNNWIITAAAHSQAAVRNAINNGADAVLISPIFITTSYSEKTPKNKPLGILKAAKLISHSEKKHICAYALGGVKPNHAKALKLAGFQGFAAISAYGN